jgi:hypothetical protein
MALGAIGEISEYAGENAVYQINKIPGGKFALQLVGIIAGGVIEAAHSVIGSGAKLVLSQEQLKTIAKEYHELPHGIQVLGKDIADGAILGGAAKLVSKTVKIGKKVKVSGELAEEVSSGHVVEKIKHYDKQFGLTNYEYYPTKIEWTAPAGTEQAYKVYQRGDINWDQIRTNSKGDNRFIGKTNREAALSGKAPELPDGNLIQLHHIGQDSRGPLAEISGTIHNPSNKKVFKALHNQFGGKGHPEFPVDHGSKWKSDVSEYWKWRVKNAGKTE